MAIEIKTSIRIKATKEVVWKILSEFENYPNWNPFIKSVTGKLNKNEGLKVKIVSSVDKEMVFKPKLLIVNENQELRWLGHFLFPRILDGEHYFIIIEKEGGFIEFIHGENFRGILTLLLGKKFVNKTKQGFNQMNISLKKLTEASSNSEKKSNFLQ